MQKVLNYSIFKIFISAARNGFSDHQKGARGVPFRGQFAWNRMSHFPGRCRNLLFGLQEIPCFRWTHSLRVRMKFPCWTAHELKRLSRCSKSGRNQGRMKFRFEKFEVEVQIRAPLEKNFNNWVKPRVWVRTQKVLSLLWFKKKFLLKMLRSPILIIL